MRWMLLTLFAFVGACSKLPVKDALNEQPQLVRVTSAIPARLESHVNAAGTVRLKREVSLSFNSGGRIASLNIHEGERVRAGQILAQLDRTSLKAAAVSASAQAARANANLKRYTQLAANGWVTKVQFEAARAEAVSASAVATQIDFEYKHASIVASTTGVVLKRQAEAGQVVAAGSSIIVLGDTSAGFVLQLAMTDTDVARISLGQQAVVALPGLAPATLKSTVSEIGARSDDATGTFRVDLTLPTHPSLRSGLIGTARLYFDSRQFGDNAVAIPIAAVFGARADEGFVYVFDQKSGRIHARMITLGPLNDMSLIVLKGLVSGEEVVIAGVDRLRDGMVVKRAKA